MLSLRLLALACLFIGQGVSKPVGSEGPDVASEDFYKYRGHDYEHGGGGDDARDNPWGHLKTPPSTMRYHHSLPTNGIWNNCSPPAPNYCNDDYCTQKYGNSLVDGYNAVLGKDQSAEVPWAMLGLPLSFCPRKSHVLPWAPKPNIRPGTSVKGREGRKEGAEWKRRGKDYEGSSTRRGKGISGDFLYIQSSTAPYQPYRTHGC
ncbi:uncharacterized protein RAG0_02089 [Rhynchosporium agropyri]|uniref:Secreted protein n=1 Tax=Rhynchosporium agropyri TaxID=914238 RepID=A0A1E1K041_9HELO|nr:uncharacterized protein RAG0_02089 [Rhynchosporium agropyri]